MRNISFFKKVKFFLQYKKIVKNIQYDLEKQFNIRIDEAYRLYTVININNDTIEDIRLSNQNYDLLPKQMEDNYIDSLYQKTMKDFTNMLSTYLDSKGLSELYDFYQIEKINKFSYLVVMGFSLFRSDEFYKKLYQTIQISIVSIIGFTLFLLIFKYLLD